LIIIFTGRKDYNQKRKGYFIFHRDVLCYFNFQCNFLPSFFSQSNSFMLISLPLQGSTKLQSKFIITDSNMQIPIQLQTLHL
jgi:hypothetical protein